MVILQTKREREEDFSNITTNYMENCMMLFSRQVANDRFDHNNMNNKPSYTSRVFECKTCNRKFPSFQALGGHRASHKKLRLSMGDLNNLRLFHDELLNKPKTHECSICGLEFAIGQALGGHMRRHRALMNVNKSLVRSPTHVPHHQVVKKLNGGRIFSLDLNLIPMENDLEFKLGKENCCFV